MATNNAVNAAAPPRPSPPPTDSPTSQHSPLEATQDDGRSTTEAAAPDDLDPAAFLKSVRELSEKREREDNERYRRLEEEIEKGRSERLARRAERARSISPEKQQAETPSAPQNSDSNVPTPSSTRAAFGSPTPVAPLGSAIVFDSISNNMANNEPPQRASVEVPEFKGFGSIKRSSVPSTPASISHTEDASQPAVKPSPSAAMPSRSNTMKWQQRPTPRGSRPMSMAAPSPSRETSTDEPQAPRERFSARAPTSRPMSMAAPQHTRDASVDEPQPSREQIAASLGARDPAYFKQTADRGLGNAAFRKSKDETSSGDDVFAARRGLPGMSKELPRNEERTTSPAPESVTSDTPSRFGSIREDRAWSARSSGTPSVSDGKTSSDLPFRTQSTRSSVTTDTNEAPTLGRTPTMSASQARLANASERPPSPTKGMGGFVQSALMKRSDSQTKRWSAQQIGGLQRQDSSASVRSGLGGLQGSYSMPKLDPIDASGRGGSHEPNSRPNSRPSSSSSNLTTLVTRPHDDGSFRQTLPSRNHSRSKSVHSTYSTSADHDGGLKSPLGSPSKRFSPNKSSWIESALARPDSPKASPSRPAQPSWMENIARAKANRNSVHVDTAPTLGSPNPNDRSRPGSPTKETPFGPAMLKRSDSRDLRTDPKRTSTRSITPPTKAKPISLSSRPTSLLTQESLRISEQMAAPTTKDETDNYKLETMAIKPSASPEIGVESVPLGDNPSMVVATEEEKTESLPDKQEEVSRASGETEPVKSLPSSESRTEIVEGTPDLSTKVPEAEKPMPPPPITSEPSITPKPEPSPKPTTDFRSTLRSRPVSKPDSQEQPEFLSKFGTLRKAQQEKYVAPDVLKANITRGKRGLTITEGPQKRERKDELRDSLLAKKEQWQQEKDAGIVHERKISEPPASPEKPEALATRELLGRNKSVKGPSRSPEKTRNITPEAIRFRKSIREKPKVETPAIEQAKPDVVDSVATEPSAAPLSSSSLRKSVTEPLPSPPAKEHSTAESLERTVSLPRSEKRDPPPPAEERSNTYPPVAATAPTSKLAARFNPALAGILARGPPASGGSPTGSRSESPAGLDKSSKPVQVTSSEPPVAGAPLADVRKGRAKGPKKRKGGTTKEDAKNVELEAPKQADEPADLSRLETPLSPSPTTKPSPAIRPTARFGEHGAKAAASIMAASLGTSLKQSPTSPQEPVRSPSTKSVPFAKPTVSPKPSLAGFPASQDSAAPAVKTPSYLKRTLSDKPATPLKDAVPEPKGSSQASPAPAVNTPSYLKRTPSDKPATPLKDAVPEFKGFGSRVGRQPAPGAEEDKENKTSSSPSVKDTASAWGRKKTYMPLGSPSQIQLPTRKDEEAAMRSASLLASSPARSPSRPDSRGGLGISSPVASPSPALPPKPAKSSRVVSGQLKEVFPNKDSQSLGKLPETEAERLLVDSFGSWPRSTGPISIDTRAVVAACSQPKVRAKTLRKSIQKVAPDGSVQQLRPQEEYTLFDESVYVCSHTHIPEGAAKSTHVIVWTGGASTSPNVDAANVVAKAEARREGSSTQIRLNQQGREEAELFEALGGIIVTRRGARESAPKQFMLRGRKHLGHIAFDEVDFAIGSLCSAFAYLISFPVTLQETKFYLWKGAACSSEEIGAAKLAAMDLSETGEIIEVDQGAEFSSFLKIFGPDTTKASVPQSSPIWQHKSIAPGKFATRLFNIHQADTRAGIFSTMFRRPSWGMRAPAPDPGVKVEVKEIAPFTQSDLDAEGIYLLDAYGELHLLLGPLFSSLQPENVRNALLAQSLLFVLDYATSSASMEDRPRIPKANVVFRGCPEGVDGLFRGWDDEHGLWGLGGLMAGSSMGKGKIGEELKSTGALDLVRVVCR